MNCSIGPPSLSTVILGSADKSALSIHEPVKTGDFVSFRMRRGHRSTDKGVSIVQGLWVACESISSFARIIIEYKNPSNF